MSANGYLQLAFYVVVLIALAKPIGAYMARIYEGRPAFLNRVGAPFERLLYRLCGVDSTREMRWTEYALAAMLFNILGLLAVYLLLRLQGLLPLNPQQLGAVSPDLAFNTAVSFATNTNWQSYGGETTLSYLTQMLGLTVQNFVSAATGMAVLVALIRGFQRASANTIGNFWVDLTRSTLYILLPLSLVGAVVLVSQGVVQTFSPYQAVQLVQPVEYDNPKMDAAGQPIRDDKGNAVTEPTTAKEQTIALGPAASQVMIKQLGTNGGGFFNVNSAHPLENPTPLSNFIEVLSILLIGAALCFTFGRMVNDWRQGWALLAVMLIILVPLMCLCVGAEERAPPTIAQAGVDVAAHVPETAGPGSETVPAMPGGNMEGKETRFGTADSAVWAAITTAASNGSVNAMHDSFTPLGGFVPLILMQLGEVVVGGVGSGLYGLLMFAIVAVFISGLMVGRTPEYLGKKIEAFEMKMASVAILVPCLVVLAGTAIAVASAAGRAGILNPGPHGFSEILYAFSSAGNNNGSAFAGLTVNTPFYNTLLGLAMLLARYWVLIPALAVAGSLAAKGITPATSGTLPTHRPLFVVMLTAVVLIVGALTFFPALALGPLVEHLRMLSP